MRACLVADVGGTNARVAWAGPDGALEVHGARTYACAEHPSLAAILADFLLHGRTGASPLEVDRAVVAIAGFLDGDRLVNANLPWSVSVRETAQSAGLAALQVINDFEAVAHAIPRASRDGLVALTEDAADDPGIASPALVLGPGTGLGAALCLDEEGRHVLLTEAGHAALAANDALQLDVLRALSRRWPHVDNERVLSGLGMMNLYDALAGLRGQDARWRDPGQVVRAAAGDALAREALDVFCGWLGSLVGDLALTLGAHQVYLAGGVTTHIAPFLHAGRFQRCFADRLAQSKRAVPVPVWRVEHGQLGLLGAAARYRAGLFPRDRPQPQEGWHERQT